MSANKNSAENGSGRNKGKEVANDNMEVPPATNAEEAQEDPDSGKRKRYHRHSQHQIQHMEMFFKECPHPYDKQRKALGDEVGLDPLQIKFWFQNKRTQMKAQQERHENALLKGENEKLRADNARMLGMTAEMMRKLVTPFYYNHMPSCTLDLGGGNYVPQSGTIAEMYGGGNFLIRSLPVPTERGAY
ncbi:Homeobox-like domain superfamily [Sesbania bispinosa]|nr:Homeobox-like domain superfamily [Sesbania bispinosa]